MTIKKKLPRQQPPATGLSRSDKFKLLGYPALALVGLSLLYHFTCVQGQKASISKTVEGWKTTYHINDEQASRIKQIELDFHGNGSPFSIKSSPTREEKHLHHEEISRIMSPEDGAHFMKVMERSEGKH